MRLATSLLFLTATLAACDHAAPEPPVATTVSEDAFARGITVEAAPEWDALFDRDKGWTGADGIFSIPLSGVETPGTAGETMTAFVFSDTFVGDVRPNGSRVGARLVNNTLAMLDGGAPDPSQMQFYIKSGAENPEAVFVPNTPNAEPGDWYWLQDAFVNHALGGATYIFALRVRRGGGSFEVAGVSVIKLPAGAQPPFEDYEEVELPFYRAAQNGRGDFLFGPGLFLNTAAAGVPDPDGYLYVYGTETVPFNKHLLAARVRPEDIERPGAWRFYDGTNWVTGVENAARLTAKISNELSVSPIPGGGYALVFKSSLLYDYVAARTGPTPVGPFGPIRQLYTPPEYQISPDVFTYNAKAHPHLSEPGTLLISYNVNTYNFFEHFSNADIYRPRFFRVHF